MPEPPGVQASVWAAAGTPHDVFGIETGALLNATPGARVLDVGRVSRTIGRSPNVEREPLHA
jgi:hypothetical protein